MTYCPKCGHWMAPNPTEQRRIWLYQDGVGWIVEHWPFGVLITDNMTERLP